MFFATMLVIMSTHSNDLRHCLSIEHFNKTQLIALFKQADHYLTSSGQLTPLTAPLPLKGVTVANLFLEPSTRTRCSFELAATYLGAHVLNIDLNNASSAHKGETLTDTLRNLEAMRVRCFIIRHHTPGAVQELAQSVSPDTTVINAGDGIHAHPTQALLDTYTLWRRSTDFSRYRVAIIGDIAHSRVARSQIAALSLLEASDIRLIAPSSLLPEDVSKYPVTCYEQLETGLQDVNVIICLRIQKERIPKALFTTLSDFHQQFGINTQTLGFAHPKAVVMHPGPVNYGVEITKEVATGSQSLILEQVTNGVALRMALLAKGLKKQKLDS